MNKVIVITGTSSGLGLSLAIKLAKQGHCVYATMRDLSKKGELVNASYSQDAKLFIKSLNVSDTTSINTCINEIIKEQGRIDCLVNNAGMGFIKSTELASETEIKEVIDTNFIGVVRCIKAVLPHMRKAGSGHIINISSVGGLIGQPFNEIYCASKFALEGYTESMATYIPAFFNVKFSLVEPGGITSEFANNLLARYKMEPDNNANDYEPCLQQYLSGAQKRLSKADSGDIYQTSSEVADCVVDVINNPNPPLRVRSSDWANNFCAIKTQADPDGLKLVKQINELFLS
ncbi:retinol dehydrogenase [Legionella beliardensis]|uniref:Retinol dehydrogenase n=1 Tax=Legionella beliardensis TaxID=91822 RepID=A0A378I1L2_9GAMM|nr:SDR family oxidoreductase [Legionella beliardensis]STX28883.1 retinol dehydrogenase [Legionella beliardensis]